ncbi:stage II sporulation protein M [Patescibacteria group bacterium]|nr:stage II sporulation protein M [Patescibacteria group bacterium]
MIKKNKKKFFADNYVKSWVYLKKSVNFIYIIIGIFLFFSLIGFFIPVPELMQEKILDFIKELLNKTDGMPPVELIKFIFLNNLQSSFFGMTFGFFLGIFPVIAAIANGYLLGFVALISVDNGGWLILIKLLPHGIFELPAIFISLGLGLKCGTCIFKKEILKNFNEYLINSLRVFLFIVIPLLLIAGIIEGSLIFLLNS